MRRKAASLENTAALDEVASRRTLPNIQQPTSQQEADELWSSPVRRDDETPEESETEHTDEELGSDIPWVALDPKGSEQPRAQTCNDSTDSEIESELQPLEEGDERAIHASEDENSGHSSDVVYMEQEEDANKTTTNVEEQEVI